MIQPAVRQWPLCVLLVALLADVPVEAQSRARVWEEPLVLPAYEVNPPDHNPRFYAGRAYQGAQGRVYPYAMIDDLTDNRVEKTYRAVYLEFVTWIVTQLPRTVVIDADLPISIAIRVSLITYRSRGRVQLTTDGHKPYLEASKPCSEWRSTTRR